MKFFLKKSKWIHKYFGLILLLFIAWMSISGVLLNHPKLIEEFAVPNFLTPSNYLPNNWNRSSLKGIVYTGNIKNDSIIIYGNQGVFIRASEDDSLKSYIGGEYPQAPRLKRTNHIFADTVFNRLLAATNKGVYCCEKNSSQWKQVELPDNDDAVKKILLANGRIVVISASGFYASDYTSNLNFEKIAAAKNQTTENIPLFRVFLELHDGSIWGLPGKLLWDIAGIVLFFICVSAFYIWFYPKKWKRKYKRKKHRTTAKEKRPYRFFHKYHKKLGWYFAIILLIIFITGIFLRPPLIIVLAKGSIDKNWYPSIRNSNPWHHKIHNALYDSANDRIVLDCSDGIWAGNLFDNKAFERQNIALSIFAMGATVFEEKQQGVWLVGSFGGLDEYDCKLQKSKSLLQIKSSKSRGRPSSILVSGYVKLPNGTHCVTGHYKGLCNLDGKENTTVMPMPDLLKQNYRMPLWNFFFELHNARIFRSWIGGFYMLIIPLGGLLGVFILISGIYDYWATRKSRIAGKLR